MSSKTSTHRMERTFASIAMIKTSELPTAQGGEVTSPTVPRAKGVNAEFFRKLKSDRNEREELLKNPSEDKAREVVEHAVREWQTIGQKDNRSSFGSE